MKLNRSLFGSKHYGLHPPIKSALGPKLPNENILQNELPEIACHSKTFLFCGECLSVLKALELQNIWLSNQDAALS